MDKWLEIVLMSFLCACAINSYSHKRYYALFAPIVIAVIYAAKLEVGAGIGEYLKVLTCVAAGYMVFAGATRERTFEIIAAVVKADLIDEAMKDNPHGK